MFTEDWHPHLVPVSEFIRAQTDLDLEEEDGAVCIERIELTMPIELATRTEKDGRIALAVAPPTQRLETTVLPVFHTFSLTLEVK